jgi:DamX protein
MQAQILPSRAALVDRIALQFEYGQNLIVLTGKSGLGKSYLLETFITDKYPDFNKAFVQISAKMPDTQLITSLLEQSFHSPLVDHSLSLTDNFYQLNKHTESGPCLWVIDGGKHLSEEMVNELETLAKNSPTTLYIMVATQSQGQFKDAVELHLEPLSIKESKQLMQSYFKSLPYDEDPIFNTFLVEAKGNPSLLLAWQAAEQQSEVAIKDKVSWRVHLITLLIIIMLLIIGLLYKNDMQQWWQAVYKENQFNEPITTAINVDEILKAPQEPMVNKLKAADVEPAPIVQVAHSNDVPAIMQSLNEVSSESKAAEVPNTQNQTDPDTQPLKVGSDIQPVNDTLNVELWHLTQPDDNVVIQLLAVTQEKVSTDFIESYQLQNLTHVYQTRRDNKIWWVVTYGSFKGIPEAKSALAELPTGVQKNKPFFKKISKITQEIALLDQ